MFQLILYFLTSILVTLLTAAYLYKKWAWSYWNRRGVLTYEPKEFMEIGNQYIDSYFYFKKKGAKLGGTYLFFHPHYVVTDLDLIKKMLISDFDHFVNRGLFEYKEGRDSMNAHLFNIEDQEWKTLRTKLSPTFTSGKIKTMFQTIIDTTWGLEAVLKKHAESKLAFEIKDVMARFTTDVIGSVGFGIECNSLKNPDSDFRRFGKELLANMDSKTVALYLFSCLPKIIGKICQQLLKGQIKKAQADQFDTHEFFRSIVGNTVAYREKNDIFRNDFLHLLLLLKNKGTVDDINVKSIKAEKGHVGNLTLDEITAQCFLFFIAGFETSSTAITFALYELSKQPDIQENLREEIHETLAENNGKMTYDSLMKMNYLNKVVNETLRMYPPVRVLTRTCRKDFPIPDIKHVVKKNEMVMIPVQAIHYDPELYPDPATFNPERFSADEAPKHTAQYMPFGEGPRMCIGSRFAQVQVKVGLSCILNKFRVSLNRKTKLPLQREKSFLASGAVGGIWVDIEKI